MKVRIARIDSGAKLPGYKHKGDSGMDLYNSGGAIVLKPGERSLIPTGIKVAIPQGYEIQVRPRSGLAINKGITVLNTPGTIDSAYRGEVKVIILNTSGDEVEITENERVAQIVLNKVEEIEWEETEELEDTERGAGGFGSTGQVDN